jgi:hypothetical protein
VNRCSPGDAAFGAKGNKEFQPIALWLESTGLATSVPNITPGLDYVTGPAGTQVAADTLCPDELLIRVSRQPLC